MSRLILPRRDLIVPRRNRQGGFVINPYLYAASSGDPSFASVVALLHGDGSNGSTTITDHSASAKTWTVGGNAAISTAQSKFGGASIAFDGSGDYLTTASHADWAFGTGDLTVESWVRWTTHTATSVILSNYTNATNGWWLRWNISGDLQFGYGDTGLASSVFSPTNGQWYHIAWCRAGSSNRLFVDGTQIGITITSAQNYASTAALYAGRLGALDAQNFNGYLDDIRITKGAARYTSNFTAPTAAFPNS